MRLAKGLSDKGAKDIEFRTLTNLFSIACEPVPLAKLLLYADTYTRKTFKKRSKAKRLQYVKDLINGAFLPNAKPSISGRDMEALSSEYINVINRIGLSDTDSVMNEGIKLRDIISIVTEITSHTSGAIINNTIHNITDEDYDNIEDKTIDRSDANIGVLKLVLALAESDINGICNHHF